MNKRKIYYIIAGIIIILVISFVFAYTFNLSIVDSILPNKWRDKWIEQTATKYFPNLIGPYSLIDEVNNGVEVKNLCNKIENNIELKKTGRTGDVCVEIFTALYTTNISSTTSTTTNKIVKVDLSRFTKSSDLLHILIEKTTTPDILNNQPIFRTAPFRLGWSPLSRFDVIMIDEGQSIVASTTIITEYEGIASGNNEVTQYFLHKYPSKK